METVAEQAGEGWLRVPGHGEPITASAAELVAMVERLAAPW